MNQYVTPVVSLLTRKNHHQQMRDTLAVKNDEEEEAFHVIPRTLAGRLALTIVILGFALFCTGVVSAHWDRAESSWLAVGGMLTVFVGGGMRVMTN